MNQQDKIKIKDEINKTYSLNIKIDDPIFAWLYAQEYMVNKFSTDLNDKFENFRENLEWLQSNIAVNVQNEALKDLKQLENIMLEFCTRLNDTSEKFDQAVQESIAEANEELNRNSRECVAKMENINLDKVVEKLAKDNARLKILAIGAGAAFIGLIFGVLIAKLF